MSYKKILIAATACCVPNPYFPKSVFGTPNHKLTKIETNYNHTDNNYNHTDTNYAHSDLIKHNLI